MGISTLVGLIYLIKSSKVGLKLHIRASIKNHFLGFGEFKFNNGNNY